MMTSQPSTQDLFGEPLTYSQPVILASRSARRDDDAERKTLAISGRMCAALSTKSGPLGACLKTLLVTSRWDSTLCYLTWKPSRTPRNQLLFQLVPRTRRTEGTEFGLLPTPISREGGSCLDGGANSPWRTQGISATQFLQMLPTPNTKDATTGATLTEGETITQTGGLPRRGVTETSDGYALTLGRMVRLLPTPHTREAKSDTLNWESRLAPGKQFSLCHAVRMLATPTVNGNYNRKGLSKTSGDGLATQAKLLSTPQARDYQTGQAERFDNPARSRNLNDQMATEKAGKLSVTFVAWMMGYPPDWCEIE